MQEQNCRNIISLLALYNNDRIILLHIKLKNALERAKAKTIIRISMNFIERRDAEKELCLQMTIVAKVMIFYRRELSKRAKPINFLTMDCVNL